MNAAPAPARPAAFSLWVRWACAFWLVVWIPAYWRTYGWQNFFRLCDMAVVITCLGIWRCDALLLSSQAVSSLLGDAIWALDLGWRLVSGSHLIGGTEYMWDSRFPLWVRLLSLFHIVLPLLLLWAVHRTGYDRRGWILQTAIAAILLVFSRLLSPGLNLNFAYSDPLLHRAWGPAPLHLAVILLVLVAIFYLPMHWALAKVFAPPAERAV